VSLTSKLGPRHYPLERGAGDSMVAEVFELEWDGEPWLIDSATARVRAGRGTRTAVLLELTCSVDGATLTVGDEDTDTVPAEPGAYWWTVRVFDAEHLGPGGLTLFAGEFEVK
jgi:hypothetical protein